MGSRKYFTLEIVRAFTIILVVIGHYTPDNAPLWYDTLIKVIYTFHMPTFLFISGFLYMHTRKEETYISFLFKKVKRLLIPYFVTSIIIITIKLIMSGNAYLENPVTIDSYYEILFLPSAGYFLWFVIALWWMFVILPFFKTRKYRLVLFLGSIILAFIPIEFTRIFCLEEFKNMFLFFMLGVTVCDYKDKSESVMTRYSHSYIPLILFSLFTYLYLTGICYECKYFLPFLGIIVILQSANILECSKQVKLKNAMFSIASSSYIIYLFHTTFEGFAKSCVVKLQGLVLPDNTISFIISSFVVILLGLIGPIILHCIFKKSRFLCFLFGLK